MRIHKKLADGRVLEFGGRNRYAAFRLTLQGGYSFASSTDDSESLVARAKDMFMVRGFKTCVVDTHSGEIIARYPSEMRLEVTDG